MATTLSKLADGSIVPKMIVLIEGYSHPLSDATEAQVQAVLSGTDWDSKTIIPSIVVELENTQSIHPWNPFVGAGRCTLKVPGGNTTAEDTFGIDLHRTDDGAESLLTATADRNDTTIFVESADEFPWGSNYDAHIGTECFGYTLKGSTSLSGHGSGYRGKYSPFGTYNSTRFAQHHRVTTADNGVRLAPLVTEQPRSWRGRRVGVWMHHLADGALNSTDDALCVFAGFVSEPADDESGWTHVLCEHELDDIKDAVCGRDMFEATLGSGHYLAAGYVFSFQDENGTAIKNATDLTVVTSGATGNNQINAGLFALEEIANAVNNWLGNEVVETRIYGNYTLSCPEDVNGTPKSVWHWYIPGSGSVVQFHVTWPTTGLALALGYTGGINYWSSGTPNAGHSDGGSPGSPQMKSYISGNGGSYFSAYIEDETGTFQDNYATLPAAIKAILPTDGGGYEWGLFLIEGDAPALLAARISRTGSAVMLLDGRSVDSPIAPGLKSFDALQEASNTPVPVGSVPPRIRQIFVHEGPAKTILKWFMYSTGTADYNHATYDKLPPGQGLGRPYGLLGSTFDDSCDGIPGADNVLMVVIDKPIRFIELLKADLVLRRAHLIWRQGGLLFTTWATPSAALAVATLNQSTKAEAVGVEASHRAPSVLDGTWAVNLVKLNYNRDATKTTEGGGGSYLSPPIILEDATSVDDMGSKPTVLTLDCRNTYGDADAAGQGIRALASGLLEFLPYFSRPIWKTSRSIAMPYYESIGVGDVVLVTDPFVRDPTSGTRGITLRPALIVRHTYSIGGAMAGDPTQTRKMHGTVEVIFLGNDRTFAYSPCAEVDFSAAGSGYDGSVTLTCEAHAHSDTDELTDVERFADTYPIKIVEVDPVSAASPDSWDRTVSGTPASNQIVINSALSSPSFDAAKRYRVIFDSYKDLIAAQQSKAAQAGTSGKIAVAGESASVTATINAHHYGANNAQINDWVSGWRPGKSQSIYHTTIPELPANLSYGQGAPRDTGYDKELALLFENLMDHKTGRSSPFLDQTARGNTDYDGYQLLFCRPIFLGLSLLGNGLNRHMWIRPLWRAAAGSPAGTAISLRVSISGRLPTGTSRNAVTIKSPAVGNIWNTQGGYTDWVIGDEMAFTLGNFNLFQYGFLIVEGTKYAECRGCPQVVERERFDQ